MNETPHLWKWVPTPTTDNVAEAKEKCSAWSAAKSGKQSVTDRLGLPWVPKTCPTPSLLLTQRSVTWITRRSDFTHVRTSRFRSAPGARPAPSVMDSRAGWPAPSYTRWRATNLFKIAHVKKKVNLGACFGCHLVLRSRHRLANYLKAISLPMLPSDPEGKGVLLKRFRL